METAPIPGENMDEFFYRSRERLFSLQFKIQMQEKRLINLTISKHVLAFT